MISDNSNTVGCKIFTWSDSDNRVEKVTLK